MKWQEFYTHPFVLKEHGDSSVYTSKEDNYVFEFIDFPEPNKVIILNRLNGLGSEVASINRLRYCPKTSMILEIFTHQKVEKPLLSIKKWGGWKGNLGLSSEEAQEKRNEFGRWIIKQLTKKKL